jgi:uroporphyrinogen III methyltransferase/synthase
VASSNVVVITRDPRGYAQWRPALESRNFRVYESACIKTVPTELDETSVAILGDIKTFDWIVFTSATAIRAFASLASQGGVSSRTLTSIRMAAVGDQTADQIKALGFVVSFTPSRPDARTLGKELKPVKNLRLLLPRAVVTPMELTDILTGRSAEVIDMPVYETIPVTDEDTQLDQLLLDQSVKAVIFASPSAVTGFLARTMAVPGSITKTVPVVAIGRSTADALASAGFTNIHTSDAPTIESISKLL